MVKVVILAGGLGTRISEETQHIPKPMVLIGGKPILWHIMKIYSAYNIKEFIVCLGYKSYVIKEYFANYWLHMSDVTISLGTNSMKVHANKSEDWEVTLVDTGELTMTGGRIKGINNFIKKGECFCLTYGDGLADINVDELISAHNASKKLATVTAVKPAGRFGALNIDENGLVRQFIEKPDGDGNYINGGFFVLSPEVIKYIEGSNTIWEQQPLMNLSKDKQLNAFKHHGFWQPMDTLRDKLYLEKLWQEKKAPWKVW